MIILILFFTIIQLTFYTTNGQLCKIRTHLNVAVINEVLSTFDTPGSMLMQSFSIIQDQVQDQDW